jgi:hypothetical protein
MKTMFWPLCFHSCFWEILRVFWWLATYTETAVPRFVLPQAAEGQAAPTPLLGVRNSFLLVNCSNTSVFVRTRNSDQLFDNINAPEGSAIQQNRKMQRIKQCRDFAKSFLVPWHYECSRVFESTNRQSMNYRDLSQLPLVHVPKQDLTYDAKRNCHVSRNAILSASVFTSV